MHISIIAAPICLTGKWDILQTNVKSLPNKIVEQLLVVTATARLCKNPYFIITISGLISLLLD